MNIEYYMTNIFSVLKRARHALVVLLLLASPFTAMAQSGQKIQIYMTVDWEGISLEPENIEAMQVFRKQFPNIPMLQLLNPVYFIRDSQQAPKMAETIRSTFLPSDTQGLHIHGWKSLANYCKVPYQHTYSFANTDENCQTGDCGYTVSIELAYSEADLTQLIACSSEVLTKNGFAKPMHFRSGGWQLGPKLKAALQANAFVWDSSRTDASLLSHRWGEGSSIVKMLRLLHPTSTPLEQPFSLSDTLQEYPNNASLADYTSTKQIIALFKQLLAENKRVMVLGFHQETANEYLHRLAIAIPQMEALAKEQGVEIEWVSH